MVAEGSELGATVIVEEEEGSSNVNYDCSATSWLQVEMVIFCRRQQKMAAKDHCWQCWYGKRSLLVVINSLLAAIKADGSERSLLVAFVPQESTASCNANERSLSVALKGSKIAAPDDRTPEELYENLIFERDQPLEHYRGSSLLVIGQMAEIN
ncbi:hypothetical protein BHE74_00028605 [Ensete ventricosum]|nr:hypothetical protein GW17_00024877 [Ensete ventricosum]RWW64172.1 hypothetical protein BHE74_00028605 [Ensete ventricosum]RZR77036.1 hypothetical protein BHM03_00002003 [Ensete ventricosum]